MSKQANGDTGAAQVGVQELIDRLKSDGVDEGQREAEVLIASARQQALRIVDEARREADCIVSKAKQEAQHIVEFGEADLRLASRDALLKLKKSFQQEFQQRFTRLVKHTIADESFTQQLILEVARRSVPDDPQVEMRILIPSQHMEAVELSNLQSDAAAGSMAHFVLGLCGDVLRDGITFAALESKSSGIRVQLVDQDVELDLTDEALSVVLMRFLAPRFRAITSEKE